MKKLLAFGDRYAKQSTWKDFALRGYFFFYPIPLCRNLLYSGHTRTCLPLAWRMIKGGSYHDNIRFRCRPHRSQPYPGDGRVHRKLAAGREGYRRLPGVFRRPQGNYLLLMPLGTNSSRGR